jgi:hypothetical protein
MRKLHALLLVVGLGCSGCAGCHFNAEAAAECVGGGVEAGKSIVDAVHAGKDGWEASVLDVLGKALPFGACILRSLEAHRDKETACAAVDGCAANPAELGRIDKARRIVRDVVTE